jgi:hypothetical protein
MTGKPYLLALNRLRWDNAKKPESPYAVGWQDALDHLAMILNLTFNEKTQQWEDKT